jgi:endonuclease G
VLFGVPTDADASDDVLLDRDEFVVSYNPRLRGPNWVAWRLREADLGRVRRKNNFRADTALPTGLFRVEPNDFAHSGFDRGHLCPSADRTANEAANERTFLMTNMAPQLHELNAGPWEELESYTRDLLRRRVDVIYLVAGALYDAAPAKIGRDVSVPNATYKVLLAFRGTPRASADADSVILDDAALVTHEEAIMPNQKAVQGTSWSSYRVSLSEVERATGYRQWSRLPPALRASLASGGGDAPPRGSAALRPSAW